VQANKGPKSARYPRRIDGPIESSPFGTSIALSYILVGVHHLQEDDPDAIANSAAKLDRSGSQNLSSRHILAGYPVFWLWNYCNRHSAREAYVHNLYTSLLVVHVLAAVLGLGSITSAGIVASTARRTQQVAMASVWLFPLLRYATFSLVAMLATGVLLDFAASGAFRDAWWFRGSVLLLIATGILNGVTRRAIHAAPSHERAEAPVLRRVERLSYGMCALLGAITLLMETKPF
jgi:hypothetical protein